MLKFYIPHFLRFPDANTEGSSSETFRTVSELQNDATPGELGAEGGSQSSQQPTDGEPSGSLNDFVSKQLGKELPPDEGQAAESESAEDKVKREKETSRSTDELDKKKEEEQRVEGDEKVDEKEKQGDEEGNDDKEVDEQEAKEKVKIPEEKLLAGKDPIPVDRFKDVITERNAAREQIKQLQPIVNDWQNLDGFCKANAITPNQFKNVMEIQALLNTDPAKALERLRPVINELEGFTGNRLPDDLQKAVDDGELSLKYAKEVAQTRAQSRFGEGKLKHDRERIESARQAELQGRIQQSVVAWENSKRESDPDYKPKTDASAPDGKWELVQKYIQALATETNAQGQFVNPITDERSMTALMQKAFDAINGSTFTRKSRPATGKPLRSDGSGHSQRNGDSGKQIEDQPNLASAVRVGLRQFGYRF